MQTLSALLAEHQQKHNVSARKIARDAGVTHTTVIKILNGENVSLTTVRKVAKYLNVDASTLLNLEATEEVDRIASMMATMLTQEPRLATIFSEAYNRFAAGEISGETLKEIAEYAAFKINLDSKAE